MVTTRRRSKAAAELDLSTAPDFTSTTPSDTPPNDYIDPDINDETALIEKDKEELAQIADVDDDVEYEQPQNETDYPSDHEPENNTDGRINENVDRVDSVIDEADDSEKRQTGENDTEEVTNQAILGTDNNTDPTYQTKRIKLDRNSTSPVSADHHPQPATTGTQQTEVQADETVRSKLVDMLTQALLHHHPETDNQLAKQRSESIETVVYNKHSQQCSNEYKHQMRELIGELNAKQVSKTVINHILEGTLSPEQVVDMDYKDLASSQLKRERTDAEHEAIRQADLEVFEERHKDDSFVVLVQDRHDLDTKTFSHGHLNTDTDGGETANDSVRADDITVPTIPEPAAEPANVGQ